MGDSKDGKAEWKIEGVFGKIRFSNKVTFASVKVGKGYFDCVAMGDDMAKLAGAKEGTPVVIWGEVWSRLLTERDKTPIMVNGYKFYAPRLMVRGAKFEAKAAERQKEESPPEDDDIPF